MDQEQQANNNRNDTGASEGGEATSEMQRVGHEESLAAAGELAEQVEQVEAAGGDPLGSQTDTDNAAGSGI